MKCSLVQDLNSCRRVHFQQRWPLHHGHLLYGSLFNAEIWFIHKLLIVIITTSNVALYVSFVFFISLFCQWLFVCTQLHHMKYSHLILLYLCMVMQWAEWKRASEREETCRLEYHTNCLIAEVEEMIKRNNNRFNNEGEFIYRHEQADSLSLYLFRGFTKKLSHSMSVLWCWILSKFMDDLFWVMPWCVCVGSWLSPKGICS